MTNVHFDQSKDSNRATWDTEQNIMSGAFLAVFQPAQIPILRLLSISSCLSTPCHYSSRREGAFQVCFHQWKWPWIMYVSSERSEIKCRIGMRCCFLSIATIPIYLISLRSVKFQLISLLESNWYRVTGWNHTVSLISRTYREKSRIINQTSDAMSIIENVLSCATSWHGGKLSVCDSILLPSRIRMTCIRPV